MDSSTITFTSNIITLYDLLTKISNTVETINIESKDYIKDGVDLKKRFFKVLDEHPFANLWSKAAKKVIAGELCDEVMKDSTK